MRIFGFEIRRPLDDKIAELPTFVEPIRDDGATVIQAVVGGATGQYIDLDGQVTNEAELVIRYRKMEQQAEVTQAINHITNEAIVQEDDQDIVALNFDENEDDDIPETI